LAAIDTFDNNFMAPSGIIDIELARARRTVLITWFKLNNINTVNTEAVSLL